MGGLNVSSGKLENTSGRKEEDFLNQKNMFINSSDNRIVFLADQEYTQVRNIGQWVASQIGYEGDLGTKQYKGIERPRMEFLENPDHPMYSHQSIVRGSIQ